MEHVSGYRFAALAVTTCACLVAAACGGSSGIGAQDAAGAITAKTLGSTSAPYAYMVYLPESYYADTSRRYPLLICLPGSGERGDGSSSQLTYVLRGGPLKLIKAGSRYFTDVNASIVVQPQCPGTSTSWNHQLLDKTITSLKSSYRVADDRVYMTGYSLGGGGTWVYALNHPGVLAAAIPVCGAAFPVTSYDYSKLKGLPVWAHHNYTDGVVPRTWSVDWLDRTVATMGGATPKGCMSTYPGGSAMASSTCIARYDMAKGWQWIPNTADLTQVAGRNPLFTVYSASGHGGWNEAYGSSPSSINTATWNWLFSKRRGGASTPAPAPTAVAIPGRLQAEAFAGGGEGVGFHELTSGTVDIYAANDGTGQHAVEMQTGEWTAYSIDVATAGLHTVSARMAAAGAGRVRIEVDGTVVGGLLAVPATGGNDTWSTVAFGSIDLAAGKHTLRLVAETGGFRCNWLDLAHVGGKACVVVDNAEGLRAEKTGTWTANSGTTGFHGTDYLFAPRGKAGNAVTFRPFLPRAGTYKVQVWYCQRSDRDAAAPVTIAYDGGTATKKLDQRVNGGQWLELGRYAFARGSTGTLKIATDGTSGWVVADAVRFVEVVPGNTAPGITAIGNRSTTAGTAVGPIAFTISDAQTAAGSLTVTATGSNGTLVPTSGIALGGSGANRTLTVTPAAGATGTCTITVRVSDGDLTASTTFTLTVTAPAAPTAAG